jgi:hypothetical protein
MGMEEVVDKDGWMDGWTDGCMDGLMDRSILGTDELIGKLFSVVISGVSV